MTGGDRDHPGLQERQTGAAHRRDSRVGAGVAESQSGRSTARQRNRGLIERLVKRSGKRDRLGGFCNLECPGGGASVVGMINRRGHPVTTDIDRRGGTAGRVGEGNRQARNERSGGGWIFRGPTISLREVAQRDSRSGFVYRQRSADRNRGTVVRIAILARTDGRFARTDDGDRLTTDRGHSRIGTHEQDCQGRRRRCGQVKGCTTESDRGQRIERNRLSGLGDHQRAGGIADIIVVIDRSDHRVVAGGRRRSGDSRVGKGHIQSRWRRGGRSVFHRAIVGGSQATERNRGRSLVDGEQLCDLGCWAEVGIPRLSCLDRGRAGTHDGHSGTGDGRDCGICTAVTHRQGGTGTRRQGEGVVGHKRARRDGTKRNGLERVGDHLNLGDSGGRIEIGVSRLAGRDGRAADANNGHPLAADRRDGGVRTFVAHGEGRTRCRVQIERSIRKKFLAESTKRDRLICLEDDQRAVGAAGVIGTSDCGNDRVTAGRSGGGGIAVVGNGYRQADRTSRGGDGFRRVVEGWRQPRQSNGRCGFVYGEGLTSVGRGVVFRIAPLRSRDDGRSCSDDRDDVAGDRGHCRGRTGIGQRQTRAGRGP